MITTSAWKNKNNATSGEIGLLLLNKSGLNSLAEVIKWNNRFLIANFHGNPKQQTKATTSIPKHNFLMGDCTDHVAQSNNTMYSYLNFNGQLSKYCTRY